MRVTEARDYPILKIKLGTDRDMEIVRIVRGAAPKKRLRVDANAAWTAKHAVRMSDFLAEQGVEMIEQPVAANDIEGLRFVRKRSKLPVFADESCLVASDVAKLTGAVDGINIARRSLAKRCAWYTPRVHWTCRWPGRLIESSLYQRNRADAATRFRRFRWAALCPTTLSRTLILAAIPDVREPGLGATRRRV
jgi:hypothetical protein